jgi:hypothetical protein
VNPRIARRAVASALIAGIAADALFDRTLLGLNVPLATLAVLAVVTWSGRSGRPADRLDLWLPLVALVASIGPALRTDPTIVALDLLVVAGSVSAWAFAARGLPVTRRSAMAVAGLGARAAAASAFGLAWLLARAGADGIATRRIQDIGRLAPFVRGVVIAVPILIGFTVLLVSADAVFRRALGDALRVPFDIDDVVGRGVFSILAAALIGGPVAIAAGADDFVPRLDAVDAHPGAETAATPVTDAAGVVPRRAGGIEGLVVLVAVDVLFGAFGVVQVVYLFGGTDTLAAIGMTYSDYARQGYFQLVGVVALAGLLLLGAHEIVGRTRAFMYAAGALLVLTGAILASAAFRLGLYQGAYGWTELRFYVAASIAWLAIGVALAIGLLLANRMRWLPHGLAIGAVAVTIVVSALGPQAFVMHENVARVLDPGLVPPDGKTGLDLDYGLTLGDDAIPDLVSALAVLPPEDRATLLALLGQRREELEAEAKAAGPLSWNLARNRAQDALANLPGS